jgi:alkylresorcinol/alkylpyrone synthase
LAHSRDVLRKVGNISSPFVLHVLQEALANHPRDGYWWMSSFGAGFSCHGALWKLNQEDTQAK